ncbi:MAG: hypothetical protein AAB414_03700 [Patescibacteria group bacterium]
MPKRKTKNEPKIERSKLRKFLPWTLVASALLIGAFAIPSNLLNQKQKKTPPKIDSISPSPVVVNKEFTITGSGFTTEVEYEGPRRSGGVISGYPGNLYQIKGGIDGPMSFSDGSPAFSPDGKTLKFKLSLNHPRSIPKDCLPGTTGKACRVSFQVINGYGAVSNVFFIEVFIPDKPDLFSSAYSPDNPNSLNVAAGAQNVEIFKIKARADAQNIYDIKLVDLMLQTGPATLAIDCDKTFGYVTAFEVESGTQVGIGGMAPNWANPGCISMFQLNPQIVLPPGTEKTILIKMTLDSTAPVGLQFNIGGGPTPDGDGAIQWVDYPGPQGSVPTITIVAP